MRPIDTDRVAWSVCRSVTLMSPAKTAEPIEMPFGLRTRVDPWNHVLDRVQIPAWEGTILGERGAHCKVYGHSGVNCAKRLNRSICRLVVDSGGPKKVQVHSYSPGWANVPSWEGTLAPPWRIRLNRPSAAIIQIASSELCRFLF